MAEAILIDVGANEGMSALVNPHVPLTPDQIVEDASRCAEAGAAIYHYHARGADGAELWEDPDTNIEIQERIAATCELVAFPTYGTAMAGDWYHLARSAPERYAHLVEGVKRGVRWDLAPVDLGMAFDTNAVRNVLTGEWTLTEGAHLNTGKDHEWLTGFAREHGLKNTFTVFDTMHLQNLRNIVDLGWAGADPLVVRLFLLYDFDGARKLQYYVDTIRDRFADRQVVWGAVPYGTDQFRHVGLALELGATLVRVGVGDYPYLEAGQPANPELVARMADVVRATGRRLAGPAEAREILGLPSTTGAATAPGGA